MSLKKPDTLNFTTPLPLFVMLSAGRSILTTIKELAVSSKERKL